MGKSKARIFRKGINDQITKMTRCDAVAKVAQYLNEGDNNSARDLITMFGLSAEEVINLIADSMDKDDRLIDRDGYVKDVLAREASSSTAVGFSVATPHAKSVHVKEPSLAFVRLAHPIKWDDSEEVDIVKLNEE